MEVLGLLIGQIITMFLYMAVGYWLFKIGKLSQKGSGEMASLLVWLVIPVVVIKSFCVEPTPEGIASLGVSTLAAAAALFLSVAVSRLLFGRRPLDHFAAAFSNAGFMGIPLVQAVFGQDRVFYVVSFIAILNILQWTYGVSVITEKKSAFSLSGFCNPLVIGTLVGVFLFFTGLGARLPGICIGTLSGLASLNGPLAMMVLGVYVAQADFKTLWTDPALYKVSAARLLLIPALTIGILRLLSLETSMAKALVIAAAAPVGANAAVYAQIHGRDYVYASKTVVVSTLLSVISMPLIVAGAMAVL
ncbi:MAG: permease [Hungatella sp.]|jgi:predicted permease|nr:permease [Hungatella sp.]